MQAVVTRLFIRINALSERERWLMLCSIIVLIYMIVENLFLVPGTSYRSQIQGNIVKARQQLQVTAAHMQIMQKKARENDITTLRAKAFKLRQELTQVKAENLKQQRQTPTPARMAKVIRQTMDKFPKLNFTNLKTLPSKRA